MTTFADIRRDMIAMRAKHGAETPIGHRCSNLIEMIPNYEAETNREARCLLAAGIQKQTSELGRLLASIQ